MNTRNRLHLCVFQQTIDTHFVFADNREEAVSLLEPGFIAAGYSKREAKQLARKVAKYPCAGFPVKRGMVVAL